jgi:hypothetical protein
MCSSRKNGDGDGRFCVLDGYGAENRGNDHMDPVEKGLLIAIDDRVFRCDGIDNGEREFDNRSCNILVRRMQRVQAVT